MTECYACLVGVATGPESHDPSCPARRIPMPEQDGKFGAEWTDYDRDCRAVTLAALLDIDNRAAKDDE